jgi:hypothetical protein
MNKFLQQVGVCSETNVSNIILSIVFHDMCNKNGQLCADCDVTCLMRVSDFYVRSVWWSDKHDFVFFKFKLVGLHVLVGSIQCQRIFFFASINVLQNYNMYSKVVVVTDDKVNIVFYSLCLDYIYDGNSMFLMVKRLSSTIFLIQNGINDFLANI